jgi:hypothetical protein
LETRQARAIARLDKPTSCLSLRTSRILRKDNRSWDIACLLVVIGRQDTPFSGFSSAFLPYKIVRHAPDSVCGMDRIRCATCSGFTVRHAPDYADIRRFAIETQVAAGVNLPEKTILDLGPLTQFTCPECKGSLVKITEGGLFRFRCHTGHGFSTDALLEGLIEVIDGQIWQAVRGFQEASMLLKHIRKHMQERLLLEKEEDQINIQINMIF